MSYRDQKRAPSLAGLVDRFGLTDKDLQDERIDRLLRSKLALDIEISQLIASGARKDRTRKIALLFGFSDQELSQNILWIVQSVLDARQCLATLRPKTVKSGDVNVKR